jgi:hypothetical protein
MSYFLIYQFDTEATVRQVTKEELEAALAEGAYSEGFLDKLSSDVDDPASWGERVLLIKGEIIVPQPVDIIRKWSVE